MVSADIDIINKLGLHARAAAKFVTCANEFESTIQLAHKDHHVNGKSIMGVMMLAAAKGTSLTLTADGGDEVEAIAALKKLVKKKFGEDA